ncbi:MAG: type I-F CRISPR-associated helicase Cas3f [bacterium]
MIVVFVSECERKAFKVSQRILDKYAIQLGRRTWMARLSLEGLNLVWQELRSKATRQMSVACHRVHGKQRTSLEWIVGTRKHFNDEGVFAFSWTQKDMLQQVVEPTPYERASLYLTTLAGLFHDMGKANHAFQQKLRSFKKNQGEAVRHDYVSFLLLESLLANNASDQEALALLANSDALLKSLDGLINHDKYTIDAKRYKQLLKSIQNPEKSHRILKLENNPILFSLYWLVLSHHRLPEGRLVKSGNIWLTSGKHTNKGFQENDLEACLQTGTYNYFWRENIAWLKAVNDKAQRLLRLTKESPLLLDNEKNKAQWFSLLSQSARTFLMLGDHVVSQRNVQQCYPGDAKHKKQRYFANTVREQYCLATTLHDHLCGVGSEASRLFWQGLQFNQAFPTITPERLPNPLKDEHDFNLDKKSRFYWQTDACQKIKKLHNKDIHKDLRSHGFFGLVIAQTGTGKTRACARIMAQLSENLRYNLALGLRTLTLQSGKAYQEELELNEEQVSTLVGSELARLLHEQEKTKVQSGSESSQYDASERYVVTGDIDVDQPFPDQLKDLLAKQPKKHQLLAAPILISTVDYLVSAANPNTSRHLYPLLRLMSSDLVLDEVDAYSEEDLIVLGKLVFLCGLYGRKVLLASATLPPALAEHFYEAYQTGYEQYCARKQKENIIYTGWFSDSHQATTIKPVSAIEPFRREHQKVITQICQQLNHNQTVKRQATVIHLPQLNDKDKIEENTAIVFNQVFAQALAFHQTHQVIDPTTGKSLSLGLVRWSNIKPCWEFARYLLEQPDHENVTVKVLCYHAKLLPVVRHHIELILDTLLKRNDHDQALLEHNAIREVLDQPQVKSLCLIVSATPIEEIGRDHDFDWAILEPSSTRSIVQSAGRVRRHRPASQHPQNVALLSTTMRYIRGESKAYRYPGVEDKQYGLTHHHVEHVYDIKRLQQSINAELLLDQQAAEEAEITALEHQKLADWLAGNAERGAAQVGLRDYLRNPDLLLSDYHAKHNQFRRANKKLLFWLDDSEKWRCKYEREEADVSCNKRVIDLAGKIPMRHYFLSPTNTTLKKLYEQLKSLLYPLSQTQEDETLLRQQLMSIEVQLYDEHHLESLRLFYHPLLGGYSYT